MHVDEPSLAVELFGALRSHGWTVAVAESLTGGLVTSTLVEVPGASRTVRGAVVAYATDLKASVLGVDPHLLASRGPVDRDVAAAMAVGVRTALGADVGLATTGVAGPEPQGGHPPGTVHVAVATPGGVRVSSAGLTGDRNAVRAATRDLVLTFAIEVLGPSGTGEALGSLDEL
ncbi:MAG: CinA family protein [Cellulomonas sp.]